MTTTLKKIYSLTEAKIKLTEELRALNIVNRLSFNRTFIYRVEVQIEKTDALLWLNNQDNPVKIFWEDRTGDLTVAAIGSADIQSLQSGESYGDFLSRILKRLSTQFPSMRYYGGFCFNPNFPPQGEWKHWKLAKFVLPLFELRISNGKTFLSCNVFLKKNIKTEIENICRQISTLADTDTGFAEVIAPAFQSTDFPDKATWKSAAAHILNGINEGKFDKIVFARAVKLDFSHPANPFLLMSQLRKNVSNCFFYIFQFHKGESFLGTSPERLFLRKGSTLVTEALAGTRPRSSKETEDAILQSQLLNSVKERHEQNYVVTMIHKILKPICTVLRFDPQPTTLKWSAGHHLMTHFTGVLKPGIGDSILINHLHPTPAVAGTPTKMALRTILDLERFDRGWYCGPIGFASPDETEFAVAIRCGLIKDKNIYLYAGAGIIKESQPQAEWDETENKLSNFLKIFDVNKE